MESIASIGQRISEARKQNGLRQIDLVSRTGVSRATIDALENGRAGDIGLSRLNRILSAVGLELNIRTLTDQRPTLDELLKEGDDD
jgi:transcriptional regulator with XRE-family HTH domain